MKVRSPLEEYKGQRSGYSERLAIEERELSEAADNLDTQGTFETSWEGSVEVFEDNEVRSAED